MRNCPAEKWDTIKCCDNLFGDDALILNPLSGCINRLAGWCNLSPNCLHLVWLFISAEESCEELATGPARLPPLTHR